MRRSGLVFVSLGVTIVLTHVSCVQGPQAGNDALERTPGTSATSWQDDSEVSAALGRASAVRVNVRTNYSTFYRMGRPVAKWKIASARPGKETPTGIFAIHAKDVCPPWIKNGVTIPGCAADNPLGRKALWFHSSFIYGMHGVDAGNIGSVTAANPRERDRSAGCVRNHPSNIEWLYQRVEVGTPVVVGRWDTDPNVKDCSGNASLCPE